MLVCKEGSLLGSAYVQGVRVGTWGSRGSTPNPALGPLLQSPLSACQITAVPEVIVDYSPFGKEPLFELSVEL